MMRCPKVYAIYLPQFHETEHNNKWWGDGFTDWIALKKAKSLLKEHKDKKCINCYWHLFGARSRNP